MRRPRQDARPEHCRYDGGEAHPLTFMRTVQALARAKLESAESYLMQSVEEICEAVGKHQLGLDADAAIL